MSYNRTLFDQICFDNIYVIFNTKKSFIVNKFYGHRDIFFIPFSPPQNYKKWYRTESA